jgi:hypothetical protein
MPFDAASDGMCTGVKSVGYRSERNPAPVSVGLPENP